MSIRATAIDLGTLASAAGLRFGFCGARRNGAVQRRLPLDGPRIKGNGPLASIAGNEVAMRAGRRRTIARAMAISGLLAIAVGTASAVAYWLALLLAIVHVMADMTDSAAQNAGA